ncbi:MAG: TonB system transport protein ExbD [Pseudorhodoplanes sp.]|nr:Biopolymer transport protein ExbD [Pseudorhodoplanes sp.]MBW7950107.1 TonB system transport protein ExbD [Pseudorhodoplanes sp.]MCL4712004.1 TonB system transport protein ExbD [Pseudorhodoplanes sp.]GIK79109.1 MAG: TonB system transport protein ExbD [Alphaproteobacteria bacterium]
MGAQLHHSSSDDLAETHEINVTPFIDVMLVLLIIFMVAAPLSTVDVLVELPASAAQPQNRPKDPLFLTIRPDLTLSVGNDSVTSDQLAAVLDQRTGGDRQERIFLRADKTVAYGEMMNVMNALRRAGYLKIALVGLEGAPAPTPPGGAAAAPAR